MKKIVCYIREKSNLLVAIPINMLLATVGLIPFLAAAQSSPAYTIQGAVRTTTDAPVVGATIVLEGTQFGTTSDVTGTFTLDLKQKPSPRFRAFGQLHRIQNEENSAHGEQRRDFGSARGGQ